MAQSLTFLWIDPCPDARLKEAQEKLQASALAIGLEPAVFRCGPGRVKFADVLRFARTNADGGFFAWCNSDLLLTRNPFEIADETKILGFHRRELPSGEICGGVDMYLFPVRLWDEILAQDIPDLWCGATHVDWWLTRAASLAGCYAAHHGYIDHPSHEESGASKNRTDPYHRHNVKAYNAWARRNGAALDQHRIVLPFIGESMSPVTDYTRWAARWLRGRR